MTTDQTTRPRRIIPNGLPPCPSWCSSHTVQDDGTMSHSTVVRVGSTSVEVEQLGDGQQGASIFLSDLTWISGQDAHDLAAVLARAAQMVQPEPVAGATVTSTQTPRPARWQAYADTDGVPPEELTTTTAAHPAPTWAADPSTDVEHETR
ncbi:MAG: hypothetical protein M3R09_07880 [Actinomycetota bacterium]|nr:hypothetical protein [Actinomycetota bacterium]